MAARAVLGVSYLEPRSQATWFPFSSNARSHLQYRCENAGAMGRLAHLHREAPFCAKPEQLRIGHSVLGRLYRTTSEIGSQTICKMRCKNTSCSAQRGVIGPTSSRLGSQAYRWVFHILCPNSVIPPHISRQPASPHKPYAGGCTAVLGAGATPLATETANIEGNNSKGPEDHTIVLLQVFVLRSDDPGLKRVNLTLGGY